MKRVNKNAGDAPKAGGGSLASKEIVLARVLWRESTEFRRSGRLFVLAGVGSIGILVFFVIFTNFVHPFAEQYKEATGVLRGVSLLAITLCCMSPLAAWAINYNEARSLFDDRVNAGMLSSLQQQEDDLELDENGKPKFASLWAITQKRIDVYHSIATRQAESSFRVGKWATVGGFLAVLGLGVVAAFSRGGTAAIAASVVGVAGAAMTGYIGATFMKSQSEASAQLSQFFLQPVEFSRMLGIERLLDSLQPGERVRAIQRIVDSTMPAAVLTPLEVVKPVPPAPARKNLRQWLGSVIAGSPKPAKTAAPSQP